MSYNLDHTLNCYVLFPLIFCSLVTTAINVSFYYYLHAPLVTVINTFTTGSVDSSNEVTRFFYYKTKFEHKHSYDRWRKIFKVISFFHFWKEGFIVSLKRLFSFLDDIWWDLFFEKTRIYFCWVEKCQNMTKIVKICSYVVHIWW